MFGHKKNQQKDRKDRENLARKLLGRDSAVRRTFGFKAPGWVAATVRKLADALNVKMECLAEHAIDLGLVQVEEAIKDPEEREELRNHLVEVHVGEITVEKVARYDREAADDLRAERLRRFEIDRAVRRIVLKFARWFRPDQLEELIDLGYRTKLAIAAGWPPPPQVAQAGYARPRTGSVRKGDRGAAGPREGSAEGGLGQGESQPQ